MLQRRLALFLGLLAFALVPAWGVAAADTPTPRFPVVQGNNLNGESFRLPSGFEGELNLAVVAFQRWHQRDVDTWMPLAADLAKRHPNLRYYEIPTLATTYLPMRTFIDGGMRRGIPDRAVRGRTITLYTDKGRFRRSLGIRDDSSIHTLLVDRQGRVLWRAEGKLTPAHAKSLQHHLESRTSQAEQGTSARLDLVETARAARLFRTLLAAVEAAGLVDVLRGEGPFTVFAPTDAAFEKLPEEALAALLRPENRDDLAAILSYHVVPARLGAADVLARRGAKTVNGATLRFQGAPGAVRIDDARLLEADIEASNGVIHVIDTVLMPPRRMPSPAHASNPVRELLAKAISHGAPLYNDGHHAACAAIYEITAESLLRLAPDALSDASTHRLRDALGKAERTSDAAERAWILRHAMDAVYQATAAP